MRGRKAVMEALDDSHRKDDQAIFVRLVGAAQGVGGAQMRDAFS